ncbi:MAG: hypothetical protein ACI4XN_04260 [Candidatus Kurthia intestinigallinarum]
MKKQQYSSDIMWYDEGVKNAIESLSEKYPNAIPVFGGALGAYEYVNSDNPDFNKFMVCLCHAVDNARFYNWHEGVAGAVRRFCHLCLVDPALVEVYAPELMKE